ncbi:MAG: EamA family transporter [Opitutales bacterium]|nr:EamA family transporter [Opitutales bacterium]
MAYLIIVSLIWSASFALFKSQLANLDASLTAALRLTLALIVFLPFFRPSLLKIREALMYLATGSIQYGLMYVLLNQSYAYLNGWQVALMTMLTPIYIVLLDGIWKRHVNMVFLFASFLTVSGAVIVLSKGQAIETGSLRGCLLVQAADICFAFGQLVYRYQRLKSPDIRDRNIYALMFVGGASLALLSCLMNGNQGELLQISSKQWLTLVYLGTVSSGLCMFWWNLGATKVSTGILAALSNIKVPLAVFVSIALFGENAGHWPSLIVGSVVMLAGILIARKKASLMA